MNKSKIRIFVNVTGKFPLFGRPRELFMSTMKILSWVHKIIEI
jgi:hypothetical protein